MAVCGWCGGPNATIEFPHVRVCFRCRRFRQYHPCPCPGCGQTRPLGYLMSACSVGGHGACVEVCAGCAGQPSAFACTGCGREDHPYGLHRCARCVLRERLTLLLTDPSTGLVHHRLRPVFETLLNGGRPQTALYWLMRRQQRGPGLLAAMARGELAISHDTFRCLPMDRTHNYVRDLLVAVGVLPAYQPLIERMSPLLATLTETLQPHHARLLEQYAHWQVLRRLHHLADAGALTTGSFQHARSRLRCAHTFLTWLQDHDLTIHAAGQADLETFLMRRSPSAADELTAFLAWSNHAGVNADLLLTTRRAAEPNLTMSDDDRWLHVNTLLHDDGIRLYTRIAGLFMLLFAQPLTRICLMRTSQVDLTNPARVVVMFEDIPVQMPDPLAELIRVHVGRRGQASYGSRGNGWLFPGGNPGRPLRTENIRAQLVARDIQPHAARHAALFALSAQVPHMILADTLGISHTAAIKWAALAARGWGGYLAQREEQMPDQ